MVALPGPGASRSFSWAGSCARAEDLLDAPAIDLYRQAGQRGLQGEGVTRRTHLCLLQHVLGEGQQVGGLAREDEASGLQPRRVQQVLCQQ